MKRKYFKHADMRLCAWLNLHKEDAHNTIYVKCRQNHHWVIIPYAIDGVNMDYLREIEETFTGFTSFYIELPK